MKLYMQLGVIHVAVIKQQQERKSQSVSLSMYG